MASIAAVAFLSAGILVSSQAQTLSSAASRLIEQAGNTEDEKERRTALEKLAALPGDPELKKEAQVLATFVDRWSNDSSLTFYNRSLEPRISDGLKEYDFGLRAGSPLAPIAELYRGRMLAWEMIENSTIRVVNPALRKLYKEEALRSFRAAEAAFPRNRIPGAYQGRAIPWHKNYATVAGAPEWAILQREHIDRFRDIIYWWIDHRQQSDGSFGGGWGDDCEMWRWWAPLLVSFDDPKIIASELLTATASMARPEMKAGYGAEIDDVEHTAEDTTDSIVPLMLLQPENPQWEELARKLPGLMEKVWIGKNQQGRSQFRSYWYSATEVSTKPDLALDVIGNVVALNPLLLLWKKTRDPELGRPLRDWLDTWVDATARAENGKPAGILPASIRWPDGQVAGGAGQWWRPVPPGGYMAMYYTWPSVITEMTDALLVAHLVTGDQKYLSPLRSMASIRLKYLENPPANEPEAGTEAWCAAQLAPPANSHNNYGALVKSLVRCKALTGTREFDELIALEADEFAVGVNADPSAVVEALRSSLKYLGVNFPLFTSEVRYTDRVPGRYVHFLAGDPGPAYQDYVGVTLPKYELLYRMVSGDGNYVRFPMPAVRWRTAPEDIAVWVKEASRSRMTADLFHFGEKPRPMRVELFQLLPGRYRVELIDAAGRTQRLGPSALEIKGAHSSLLFQLPPQQLRTLRITPEA